MHVVELLVERDRVAADGGNGAPLGLPGIEIRGGEDNLVADRQPAAFRTWIEVAPALAVADSLVQVLVGGTVQVQGSAHEHDAAVDLASFHRLH